MKYLKDKQHRIDQYDKMTVERSRRFEQNVLNRVGRSYRLGLLSGRIRVYENQKDLVKLIEKITKISISFSGSLEKTETRFY